MSHVEMRRLDLNSEASLMNTTRIITIATAAFLVLLPTTHGAESISVLLQKAIYAEETEGNLDAAIKIYESITKGADANRSLVAQALYRLGLCELKRGKREDAEAAFRKIIGQLPDQSELVAKARERLADLGKSVSSLTVRQLWSGGASADSVSFDGRYLAFTDTRTGNVAVRDINKGQNRLLTDVGAEDKGMVDNCVLSHDAKEIAYGWDQYKSNSFSSSLLIVDVEKAVSRVLVEPQTNRWIWPSDWSPNGKWIACIDIQWQQGYMPETWPATNSHAWISLISTVDGSIGKRTPLPAMPWGGAANACFSGDGRYLAFNLPRNSNAGGRIQPTNDIVILDTETGVRKTAVQYLAHEKFIGWAPGREELLFTSDRGGTTGLWLQRLNGDETKPKLLKADVNDMDAIGITRDGALFYNLSTGPLKEYYLVSVDFAAGKIAASPKLLRTTLIRSPISSLGDKLIGTGNGRFLYFRSEEKEPAAYVLDLDSGQPREIPNSRSWANRIGWWWRSSDFKSLFVALYGPEDDGGMYQIGIENGDTRAFALRRRGVDPIFSWNPVQFRAYPDFVAYGRHYVDSDRFVLVKHDLASGQELEYAIPGLVELPRGGKNRNGGVLKPDGRTFFFNRKKPSGGHVLVWHDLIAGTQKELLTATSPIGTIADENDPKPWNLFVTSDERNRLIFRLFALEGSEMREKHHVTIPEGFEYRGQHWGEPHLILIKPSKRGQNAPAELWTMSLRTAELKSVGVSVTSEEYWGLAEDAKRFVVQTITPGSREVWVMENFLPPLASGE
jgi:hypothetical protein